MERNVDIDTQINNDIIITLCSYETNFDMIDSTYRWMGEFATAFTFICLWVQYYFGNTEERTVVCAMVIACASLLQNLEADTKDRKKSIMINSNQRSSRLYKFFFKGKLWLERVVSSLSIAILIAYVITLSNHGAKFQMMRSFEICCMIKMMTFSYSIFFLVSLIIKMIVSLAMDNNPMRTMQQ